ncbi:MAG TPA: hypothetical protein VI300_13740 [Solirubrobacter sp.]
MGPRERFDGNCSEPKLLLVSTVDYDELPTAAHAAQANAAQLASVVLRFADAHVRLLSPA